MPGKKSPKSGTKKVAKQDKRVTRYSYEDELEPRTPETGHTSLLPPEERVVSLPMDNGWTEAIDVGKLEDHDAPAIVDLDPVLDPVLFWAGKRSHREVPLLPLQRNEVISESRIARIIERAREAAAKPEATQQSLFSNLEKTFREADRDRRVEFYTHEEGWKNKLICGDSLQVMESLLHYEGLRGRMQMVYVDPPYGVDYDSNFQQRVDSTSNDQRDRVDDVLTIKAFNDTWALGIHSYLSYLQERLYLCHELLTPSGSAFVQIGEDHVHLVRSLLDEVFGKKNFVSEIVFQKTSSKGAAGLDAVYDTLLWYAKDRSELKYRQLYQAMPAHTLAEQYRSVELADGTVRRMTEEEVLGQAPLPPGAKRFMPADLSSQGATAEGSKPYTYDGREWLPPPGRHWSASREGLDRLAQVGRLIGIGKRLRYKRYATDFPLAPRTNMWTDTVISGYGGDKWYVVHTSPKVVERCIAMSTDPGDIVFDPTCGSGTTAYCAEKLGRRWITCDTSRVAVNVTRQRLLSALFDHYPTANGTPASGFSYRFVPQLRLKVVAYDLEPEKIELVDQPEIDPSAVRVSGPFEAMTIGRYALEDWKGFVFTEEGDASRLENYVSVIARLYRTDAALSEAAGVVHAVVEDESGRVAISVGPIAGRVTARQIHDAAQEASSAGIRELHVLGWAFEPNVGEIKDKAEEYHKVQVSMAMIRPDVLAEGLKVAKPETLFSPLALPDIEIDKKGSKFTVRLAGVAVFDRKERSTKYMTADSGYVSAWYLDEDYDGDCFVDCQMFFDFKRKPAIESALGIKVDDAEWKLRLESDPFEPGKYHHIAVRVVDVYGNESTIVKAF